MAACWRTAGELLAGERALPAGKVGQLLDVRTSIFAVAEDGFPILEQSIGPVSELPPTCAEDLSDMVFGEPLRPVQLEHGDDLSRCLGKMTSAFMAPAEGAGQ